MSRKSKGEEVMNGFGTNGTFSASLIVRSIEMKMSTMGFSFA